MKTKRASLAVAAVLLFTTLCFSCGSHQTARTQYVQPSVVNVEESAEFSPASSDDTKKKIRDGCPTNVSINPSVELSPNGYRLVLTWTFSGKAPWYWQVEQFRDRDDGADEFDAYAPTTVKTDEKLEFRGEEMHKGRVYKFKLSCAPNGFVYGKLNYRTITVNLRGV